MFIATAVAAVASLQWAAAERMKILLGLNFTATVVVAATAAGAADLLPAYHLHCSYCCCCC